MKISKANANKFVKSIHKFIVDELSGEEINVNDYNTTYKIKTVVGELKITLHNEQSLTYALFCRFENVLEAKEMFDCNPHSGKYNFNISTDIDEAIEMAKTHLEVTQPLQQD